MSCFSYPARDEIEIGGKKIVGSAQKRVGARFLQHGSIPLAAEEDLLKRATLSKEGDTEIRMTSLSEALGRPVGFEWAVERLAAGIAESFGIKYCPKIFEPEENARILRIQSKKYESEEWTAGRRKDLSIDFFDFE
jgi:lipoate-protein ligase A